MKYIEIDDDGYLVYEDTETGELYIVAAQRVETNSAFITKVEEQIVDAYYKD